MTPIAHISSGYLVYTVIAPIAKIDNVLLLIIAMAGSLAPDVDGFFGLKMNSHHNTVFHTPIFWTAVFGISFVFGRLFFPEYISFIYVFFLGIFVHLSIDWISSRTSGIRIFYPFVKKNYALFNLRPDQGDVSIFPSRNNISQWISF